MQPKFTQQGFVFFFTRLSAVTFIFLCTSLLSFSQQGKIQNGQRQKPDHEAKMQAKLKSIQDGQKVTTVSPNATNDVGLVSRNTVNSVVNRTEAVCATFTGALGAPDPTMAFRLNRNGVQGTCPGPKPFATPFSANTYYDTHTWVNNSGLTQCATFTLSTTDAAANIQFGVYSGSFNPADLSVNFLTDPGLSSGTPPINTICSANVNAGQTIVFVVFSPNALGTASDYTLTVDMPICASAPCTGTPAPGNTISSVTTVCPGIPFSLSLQNSTAGSGVTYQWQSGTSATGPWTNIPSATGSTLSTTQTASTWYQCNVTCSAGPSTGTSAPIGVALTPPLGCYCIPAASDCTFDDEILNVTLSTLNNSSSGCSGVGYSNYTSTVAAPIIYSGGPNAISVTIGPGGGDDIGVFIDYNQNGAFEATEYTNVGVTDDGTLTTNINIPTTALTGITRMRVRVRYGAYITATGACTTFTYGETEDYNVNIQPCVPLSITSSPASASVSCGSAASFTVATAGTLQLTSWEYRPNSSASWQVLNNGGIYSGANTQTLTLSEVSAALSGYQYRALVTGVCSAIDVSQAATLTVNPLVPVVNPASATLCLGAVQSLTLTNTLGNSELLNEGFNTVVPAGWTAINMSSPLGTQSWFQGNDAVFPSHSGAATAYAAANYQSTTTVGQISTWLITPSVSIKNGDVLKFWARKVAPDSYADRMQVRMSNIASTNVGTTSTSVGDFTTLLVDINPTEGLGVFPIAWTQYTVTISGLSAPVTGNFAFRYFISDAGSAASNGDYIGIDDVVYTSTGGAAQGVWSGPAGTMFTNSGATTAYTGTPATVIYVKPTATSNYSVIYTTPTPCTSSSTTVPITVNVPVAGLTVAPATRAVCLGGSTTFTASITAGSPVTYQWQQSVDGGLVYTNISSATSSTLTISGVTSSMTGYKYRVVATAGVCGAVTSTTIGTLTVNALPVVTLSSPDLMIMPGQTTSVTATSTPGALATNSWSWTNNGSAIAGNTNIISGIDIDKIGAYKATVTDVNGCVNSSAELVIGAEASDKMWLYPNPTTGDFYIRLYFGGELTETRKISLYSPTGQLLESREITLQNTANPYQRMDFSLGGVIAKGSYVVKVAHKVSGKVISGILLVQ